MPVVVPTNSAITTPTSENEMALGRAAKVQASALIHWAHHGGEEMVFVVSGSITVKLGTEELLMEKGDCLYFSGEERHDLRSVGTRRAEVLVVVSLSVDTAAPAPVEG